MIVRTLALIVSTLFCVVPARAQEDPGLGELLRGSFVLTLRAEASGDEEEPSEDTWCRLDLVGTAGPLLLVEGSHPECTITVERATLGQQGAVHLRVVALAPRVEEGQPWVARPGLGWRAEQWQLVGRAVLGKDGQPRLVGKVWVTVAKEEDDGLEGWRGRFMARPGELPGGDDPFSEYEKSVGQEGLDPIDLPFRVGPRYDALARRGFLKLLSVKEGGPPPQPELPAGDLAGTAPHQPQPKPLARGVQRYGVLLVGGIVLLCLVVIRFWLIGSASVQGTRQEARPALKGPEFLLDSSKLARRRGELGGQESQLDGRRVELFLEGLRRLKEAEAADLDQVLEAATDVGVAGHVVLGSGALAVENTIPAELLFASEVERTVPLEQLFDASPDVSETQPERTVPVSELFEAGADVSPEADGTTPIQDLFTQPAPPVEGTVPVERLFGTDGGLE